MAVKFALCCPGQGIVQPLLAAFKHQGAYSRVLDVVDDALGEKFSAQLTSPDPEVARSWLSRTSNAQPAILTATYIIHSLFERQHGPLATRATYLMGHSLGEYTALTLAGLLPLREAVQIVRRRGQLLEDLQLQGHGMVALVVRPTALDAVVDHFDKLQVVANINSTNQVVISGQLDLLHKHIADFKATHPRLVLKAVPLPVSIPFHNEAIRSIEGHLSPLVASAAVPAPPIISNLHARPLRLAADTVAANSHPVRWTDALRTCASAGITHLVNLGPGDVLQGLHAKTNFTSVRLSTPEDFAVAASTLIHD